MYRTMPLGIVLRRAPGVTRWAKWSWKATAVLPGAGEADWRELRRDGPLHGIATKLSNCHVTGFLVLLGGRRDGGGRRGRLRCRLR